MRRGRFPALVAALFLNGCLRTSDTGSLQAVASYPPAGPGCSACHPYAPPDKNHFTHIIYNEGVYVKRANGFVTCLDCHRASLRSTTEILFDSVYRDSNGTLWSSVDFPEPGQIPPATLIRVDTLAQHHPVPMGDRKPGKGELREWMTGMAHLNGKVDVVFDSSASDPIRFRGARAEFHPESETCSAVSCHGHDGPYRFEACSKGLPELVGEPEPGYQCFGIDAGSPSR
jgi:hypothetical protein